MKRIDPATLTDYINSRVKIKKDAGSIVYLIAPSWKEVKLIATELFPENAVAINSAMQNPNKVINSDYLLNRTILISAKKKTQDVERTGGNATKRLEAIQLLGKDIKDFPSTKQRYLVLAKYKGSTSKPPISVATDIDAPVQCSYLSNVMLSYDPAEGLIHVARDQRDFCGRKFHKVDGVWTTVV